MEKSAAAEMKRRIIKYSHFCNTSQSQLVITFFCVCWSVDRLISANKQRKLAREWMNSVGLHRVHRLSGWLKLEAISRSKSIPSPSTADGFITFRLLFFLRAFLHTFSHSQAMHTTNTFNHSINAKPVLAFCLSSSTNFVCIFRVSNSCVLFCWLWFDSVWSVLLLLKMTLDVLRSQFPLFVCFLKCLYAFLNRKSHSLPFLSSRLHLTTWLCTLVFALSSSSNSKSDSLTFRNCEFTPPNTIDPLLPPDSFHFSGKCFSCKPSQNIS